MGNAVKARSDRGILGAARSTFSQRRKNSACFLRGGVMMGAMGQKFGSDGTAKHMEMIAHTYGIQRCNWVDLGMDAWHKLI